MSNAVVYVTKEFSFEAAHHLPEYVGACANIHGHSYKMQVTVKGEVDVDSDVANEGMVLDFKELKKIVKSEVIDTHDHAYLNDLYPNPTAEVMVVLIFRSIKNALPKYLSLVSVKLWETTTSFAEYRGE